MRGASPEILRAALRRAVEKSSLRAVAEQVGMTHRGLQLLLSGESHPRAQTLRKLRTWYVTHGLQAGESSPELFQAAADFLLDGLPDRARNKGVKEFVELVKRLHSEAGLEPPRWLDAISRAASSDREAGSAPSPRVAEARLPGGRG